MRLFEYNFRLKAYLQSRADIPFRFGNYRAKAFNIRNTMGDSVSLVVGDERDVPYVIPLERGFRHYHSGRMITKHKGWLARATRDFAEMIAKEEGGVVSYD